MIVQTDADLDKLLTWLDQRSLVAFDIETTGLNVRKDRIIGFSVSDQYSGFYVPHLSWNGSELVEIISREACIKIIEKLQPKKLITFNGSFDTRFTWHFFSKDLIRSIYSEVQLARHTHNENLSPFSKLKDIAAENFGYGAKDEQRDLFESIAKNGGTKEEFYKADLDVMAKYAVKDTLLTFRLHQLYMNKLKVEGLDKFYLEDEVMPLYREVTIPMELHGIPLDMEQLQTAQQEITADIAELDLQIRLLIKPHLGKFTAWFLEKEYPVKKTGEFAQQLARYYEIELPLTKTGSLSFAAKALNDLPDCTFKRFMLGSERLEDETVAAVRHAMHGDQESFNLKSKHHWKKIFFEELNEVPLSHTPTGQPQADDDFLQSIADKYEFVPLLLDYNKLNKIKSTYIDRFLEEQDDGIFYARFQQNSTSTGRYSGDLQQLPRPKDKLSPMVAKYNNKIRSFFIAPPNQSFVGADYSQLEVVVFADDAGDDTLLNMIKNKYDFYSQVAIDVWDLHDFSADKKASNFLKEHRPNERQNAKEFALGIRYGMGEWKLSNILSISQNEAREIIKRYFTKYPKLKQRMEQLVKDAKNSGKVRSKFGRTLHIDEIRTLYQRYGNLFDDNLKLWEKYKDNDAKYKEMKQLKKQYYGLINAALNFPIQSGAASIVNRASVAIMQEFRVQGLNAYICMNVHDEINCFCPDSEIEKVKQILQDKMEFTTKLSVPLTAVPNVGKRYSDIK